MIVRAGVMSLVALAIGCGYTLPEPIYANQVEEYFPEPTAPDATEVAPEAPAPEVALEVPAPEVPAPAAPAPAAPAPAAPAPEAPAADVQLEVRAAAEECAARLNGRRGSAEVVGLIQSILSGFGGLASGVGGVFSAIDFGNPDITTAMGITASAGAGITLIGNFVLGFFASPLEELRLHSQGLRSWELAVELRYAGAPPEAVRESLERCGRDEGPPVRTPGAGTAFSRED